MDFIDDIEWYLDRILKDGLTSYRWDLSALIHKIKKQYNTVDDLNNYISDIEYQNRGLQDDVGDLENEIYELKQQIMKMENKE